MTATIELPTVERLIGLAANHFKVDRSTITPDADVFDSLGIDSVQVLELLSELELALNVELPDYELRDVRTFAQLAARIDQRL
jgi:acyl carrier protein